ncbi:MAG: tetratricopeptide repeat protein [Bacteroidota bacterium]
MNIQTHPNFQQALYHHQQGQFPIAEQIYRQLLAEHVNEALLYNYLSDCLLGQGKSDEVIELLKIGEARGIDNPEALLHMGSAYTQKKDFSNALQYVGQFIKLQPQVAIGHYNLANLYYYSGQPEPAILSYRQCIKLDPNMAYAHYNLANLLNSKGQAEEAISHYSQCIQAMPNLVAAYLNLGALLNKQGRYAEAMKVYEGALHIEPNNGKCHQQMGMTQHVVGQLEEATASYIKAHQLLGNTPEILMLLGNIHRDRAKIEQAKQYYEQVLALDPENTLALQNIRRISSSKIPGWHFQMLADTPRNDGFDQALRRAIQGPLKVLDIGTGSGLLAMMAMRAGASEVYACEMVPALAEAATQIVAANGYKEQIHIINKKSTALKVGEDLPEKADLLVSEIVDAGLLGEGVIPTIRHALNNLVKPNAIIIPRAANVYGVVIETNHLNKVYPVKKISGFDLSAFNQFALSSDYVSMHLKHLPHRQLSEVFPILAIDFKNLPPTAGEDQPNETILKIPIATDGQAHAIAFWFDLHIDEEISLSSGPDGQMVHWEQAIFFLNQNPDVVQGDTLELRVLQTDLMLKFSL